MEPVFDNKENIPPFSSNKQKGTPMQVLAHKKLVVGWGCGRPRKPLADITSPYRSAHLPRSTTFPDIELLVASRMVVLNVRKRRALDDIDLAQAARAKSLRIGFR